MKLKHLNYFFVGFPILLGLFGFLYNPTWFFAAIFPIFTGFFQVTSAIYLFIDQNYRSFHLISYFIINILFFTLWINTPWQWIWCIPPALALYFTYIVEISHKRETLWKHLPTKLYYMMKIARYAGLIHQAL